ASRSVSQLKLHDAFFKICPEFMWLGYSLVLRENSAILQVDGKWSNVDETVNARRYSGRTSFTWTSNDRGSPRFHQACRTNSRDRRMIFLIQYDRNQGRVVLLR